MSVYLDTSVIISHFVDDANSVRADTLIAGLSDDIIISDLCATESAAGLARLVRMAELAADTAQATFGIFDTWTVDVARRIAPTNADWVATERLLRRLEFPLRMPDMLHIVIATRVGAELATFDDRMGKVATALGLPVVAA